MILSKKKTFPNPEITPNIYSNKLKKLATDPRKCKLHYRIVFVFKAECSISSPEMHIPACGVITNFAWKREVGCGCLGVSGNGKINSKVGTCLLRLMTHEIQRGAEFVIESENKEHEVR